MSRWIKCTSWGEEPRPIFVNLDMALLISSERHGSKITYAPDSRSTSHVVVVNETPDEIFSMKAIDAHRT